MKEKIKSSKTLLIEYIGLPASGKSTTSKFMADLLKSQGFKVTTFSYFLNNPFKPFLIYLCKILCLTYISVTKPSLLILVMRKSFNSKCFSFIESIKDIVNLCYVGGCIRYLQKKPGIHIFDEGLLQVLWYCHCKETNKIDLPYSIRIWKMIYSLSPVVVSVQVDENTIVERLLQRKDHSRLGKAIREGIFSDQLSRSVQQMQNIDNFARFLLSNNMMARLFHIKTNSEALFIQKNVIPEIIDNIYFLLPFSMNSQTPHGHHQLEFKKIKNKEPEALEKHFEER